MPHFERGFKTWCESVSASLREELGFKAQEPLLAETLAKHMRVKVLSPKDVPGMSKADLDQLLREDREGWSAISFKHGRGMLLISNPTHTLGRRSSNVMHELAHLIREHESSRLIMGMDEDIVMRSYNEQQEWEADWLAGALLLPRVALLDILSRGISPDEAAAEYHVSSKLFQYRHNVTGVGIQMRRRGLHPSKRAR